MKIPGSISPIQPQALVSRATEPSDAPPDASARFGAPSPLHPREHAVAATRDFTTGFRDPARLAARSEGRAVGLEKLRQQLSEQFGPDLAAKVFSERSAGQSAVAQSGSGADLRFNP